MKIAKSNDCWKQLSQYTPNGCQTNSKSPIRYVNGIYPKVLESGLGGRVTDVDGNEYIDLIAGLGAISVGYNNEEVNKAVIEQLHKGVSFSLPTMLEYEVAKKLTELLPNTDMWKFTKTGSDATTMAIKCARAYTGKKEVIVYGYHGWHDWYTQTTDKKDGVIIDYYTRKVTFNVTSKLLNNVAAVIIEPMVFDYPQPGFLEELRKQCSLSGTVLIFDEVVTGGRYPELFAQKFFNIDPDLTVLSKGIANGFPLAAIGGRREIMRTFERENFFASTTFGGEAVSLAACLATLPILQRSIHTMIGNGDFIKGCFNSRYEGYDAVCKGYPTRLTFDFPTTEHKALFMQEMCKRGILIGYSNLMMADHTHTDIMQIYSAIVETAVFIKKHWDNPKSVLEGELPVEALRLRESCGQKKNKLDVLKNGN